MDFFLIKEEKRVWKVGFIIGFLRGLRESKTFFLMFGFRGEMFGGILFISHEMIPNDYVCLWGEEENVLYVNALMKNGVVV